MNDNKKNMSFQINYFVMNMIKVYRPLYGVIFKDQKSGKNLRN